METKSNQSESWLEGRHQFPVYYEDTDFSGYVYHANYLKFFERSREELIGRKYLKELFEKQVHYVVYKMDITFHAPARHGDVITVDTKLLISESPVGIVNQVCSIVDPDNENKIISKLCSAKIKLAMVNGEGSPIRVPKEVIDHFTNMAR